MRTASGLTTITNFGQRQLAKVLSIGDVMDWVPRKPRNVKHNNLYHAWIADVAAALDLAPEVLKLWIKRELGLIDLVQMPDGSIMESEKSTAFDFMNEIEFREFHAQADKLVRERFFPHIREDLRKAIERFHQA